MGLHQAAVISAGGGRVSMTKPTLGRGTATGQFKITNYNAANTYSATVTAGSVTISGDTITLSDANSVATIVAMYGKTTSPNSTAERKAYTYNTWTNHPYACGSYSCNCSQTWGSCGCGTCAGYPTPNSQSWGQCGCTGPVWDMCWYNPVTTCQTCTSYCDNWYYDKDATPSGYTDSYSEWWKVA